MKKFFLGFFFTVLCSSAQASWVSIGTLGALSSYPKLACNYRFIAKVVSPNIYLYPTTVSQSGTQTRFKFSADFNTMFWAVYSSTRSVWTNAMTFYNSLGVSKTLYLSASVSPSYNWLGLNVDYLDSNLNTQGRGWGVTSDILANTAVEEDCH